MMKLDSFTDFYFQRFSSRLSRKMLILDLVFSGFRVRLYRKHYMFDLSLKNKRIRFDLIYFSGRKSRVFYYDFDYNSIMNLFVSNFNKLHFLR